MAPPGSGRLGLTAADERKAHRGSFLSSMATLTLDLIHWVAGEENDDLCRTILPFGG
jgi:hypothetical protein